MGADELDKPVYRAPPPEVLQWDTEKAQTVLTSLGSLLHAIDPAGKSPHADDLWVLTEHDLAAIAPPAARIANRYSTARTLAGHSDHAGLLLGTLPYVKRNLAIRGRAKALDAHDAEAANDAHRSLYEPAGDRQPAREPAQTATPKPGSQPEQPARREPGSEPEIVDVRLAEEPAGEPAGDENPRPPADWFDHWPEGPPVVAPVPFEVSRGD